ncbi:MAG: hypothetical protein R6V20_04985 [Desulfobia sp.]
MQCNFAASTATRKKGRKVMSQEMAEQHHEQRLKKTGGISIFLCMVDVDNNCLAHFNGSVCKCVAMIGHQDRASGNIRKGRQD